MHNQRFKIGLQSLVEKQGRLFLMILTIGNRQSMKGRMVVKRNWGKSRIISPWENKHLVYLFIKQIALWWQILQNHQS